jgi:hypothetical protein
MEPPLSRLIAAGFVALLTVAACSSDEGDDDAASTTTTVATDTGWDAAALVTAEQLATTIREADVECADYEVTQYEPIAIDYEDKLPLPLAMSSCVGPGAEDFTFEVFADGEARANFMATKMQLLCTEAAENDVDFPGLPYVEGQNWLIEPDSEGSANFLADTVGGEAVFEQCP